MFGNKKYYEQRAERNARKARKARKRREFESFGETLAAARARNGDAFLGKRERRLRAQQETYRRNDEACTTASVDLANALGNLMGDETALAKARRVTR